MLKVSQKVLDNALLKHESGVLDFVSKNLEFCIHILEIAQGITKPPIKKSVKISTVFGINGDYLTAISTTLFQGTPIDNPNIKLYLNCDSTNSLTLNSSLQLNDLLHFLKNCKNNISVIVSGKPSEIENWLKSTAKNYTNLFDTIGLEFHLKSKYKPIFKKIFNYDKFSDKIGFAILGGTYEAYDLTNNLDIKTCLYCNRLYSNTIFNHDKVIRPELDHFFDKDSHPYFALSFYNLIPSCKTCNSTLKHTKKFNLEDNLHPYLYKLSDYAKFRHIPQTTDAYYGITDDIKVEIVPKTGSNLDQRVKGNVDIFKLETIYSDHADLIQDLIIKAVGTNKDYLKILKDSFRWDVSEEELHKIAFGVFPDEEDYHKRPFSQMINDIAKKLGLITEMD